MKSLKESHNPADTIIKSAWYMFVTNEWMSNRRCPSQTTWSAPANNPPPPTMTPPSPGPQTRPSTMCTAARRGRRKRGRLKLKSVRHRETGCKRQPKNSHEATDQLHEPHLKLHRLVVTRQLPGRVQQPLQEVTDWWVVVLEQDVRRQQHGSRPGADSTHPQELIIQKLVRSKQRNKLLLQLLQWQLRPLQQRCHQMCRQANVHRRRNVEWQCHKSRQVLFKEFQIRQCRVRAWQIFPQIQLLIPPFLFR